MTPEALAVIGSLIERYGLPLVLLTGFAWLILTGKLVTGSQLATMTGLFERERGDRITAEANLAKLAGANADVAEAVREALTVVIKPAPYAERLEGTPRRGR